MYEVGDKISTWVGWSYYTWSMSIRDPHNCGKWDNSWMRLAMGDWGIVYMSDLKFWFSVMMKSRCTSCEGISLILEAAYIPKYPPSLFEGHFTWRTCIFLLWISCSSGDMGTTHMFMYGFCSCLNYDKRLSLDVLFWSVNLRYSVDLVSIICKAVFYMTEPFKQWLRKTTQETFSTENSSDLSEKKRRLRCVLGVFILTTEGSA